MDSYKILERLLTTQQALAKEDQTHYGPEGGSFPWSVHSKQFRQRRQSLGSESTNTEPSAEEDVLLKSLGHSELEELLRSESPGTSLGFPDSREKGSRLGLNRAQLLASLSRRTSRDALHIERASHGTFGPTGKQSYGMLSRKTSQGTLDKITSSGSLESIDTDLEITVEAWSGGGCCYVYVAACGRYGEIPVSAIQHGLALTRLSLSHLQLTPRATRALAVALVVNRSVRYLDLSNNNIEVDGLKYITEMMLHNYFIEQLDLSYNSFGSEALKYVTLLLDENKTLKRFSADGNSLGAGATIEDISNFTCSIQNSVTLDSVSVADNCFGEQSAAYWAHVIGNNYGLSQLILRWNYFRMKGAQHIIRAMQLNESLMCLDLAWNGLSDEGCVVLGSVLLYNSVLRELDITCNRITLEGCTCVCQGLLRNTTLAVLKISKNPITIAGASSLLETYKENEESALTRLEMLDIEVDPYFESLLEELHDQQRPLEVIHGGLVLQGSLALQMRRKKRPLLGDPLQLLFEHVRNSSLRLWDLFAQFDKDKSLSISLEEFKHGMKEARLPLDDFQIERIMNALDKDKNGEITFEELLEGYKRYREKERRKYETLLPDILRRPSTARQDAVKDENAPVPRAMASTMSMQGSVGESSQLPSVLPEISITTNADLVTQQSAASGGAGTHPSSRTYTLLPHINLSTQSVPLSTHSEPNVGAADTPPSHQTQYPYTPFDVGQTRVDKRIQIDSASQRNISGIPVTDSYFMSSYKEGSELYDITNDRHMFLQVGDWYSENSDKTSADPPHSSDYRGLLSRRRRSQDVTSSARNRENT